MLLLVVKDPSTVKEITRKSTVKEITRKKKLSEITSEKQSVTELTVC